LDTHCIITNKGGVYTIEVLPDAKVLHNGRVLRGTATLNHYDRLVFGTSQYYMFIYPGKASGKDHFYTFEMAQDEIAEAKGISIKDTKNMSQEEILCHSELIDILPAIEEANQISIALDKKVKFSALPVASQTRY
jgi:hypothetical protein